MKRKTRKQKEAKYKEKYQDIPIDYRERIAWMYDKFHITDNKAQQIMNARNDLFYFMYYRLFKIILFEEPEGTPRPRFRLINRQNFANQAISNGAFVHVYSINAHEDNTFMKRMMDQEIYELQDLISIDVKSSILALDELTGELITDDILDNIFDHFCIGK